jgi:DNA polymerase elongation subunit (family B)
MAEVHGGLPMKEFYMFADEQGSRIFHRYWDGQERRMEVIDSFPIELFIEGGRKDARGLRGESLSRVEFTKISDAQEFIREYKDITPIHGQTSLVHQFLAYRYPEEIEFDISKFVIANIDIETRFDNGFPSPDRADQEIISITLKCFGDNKFVSWGIKPYKVKNENDEYVLCEDEKDLLIKFVNYWSRLKPDIVTGWNIQGFDIPYLINRVTNVLGEKVAAKLSPFSNYTSKVFSDFEIQGGQKSYRILGVTVFDYIELYKKFSYKKLERYSLDFVSHIELGERKVDYSEYGNLMNLYNTNYELFMDYNIHDVQLVENLDKKLNFMFLALTMAFMGRVRMNEIFSQVRFWDTLVYNKLRQEGIQIPPHIRRKGSGDIEGAYVKDPVPGLYKWVVSLDLTSLYPSIMMQYNLSTETAVDPAVGNLVDKLLDMSYDTSFLKERDLTMTANGATFTRKFKGVMPRLVEAMFNDRKKYKNMMLDVKREIEAIKVELDKRGLKHE